MRNKKRDHLQLRQQMDKSLEQLSSISLWLPTPSEAARGFSQPRSHSHSACVSVQTPHHDPTCAAMSTSWGSFRYLPSPSFRKSSKLPVKCLEGYSQDKSIRLSGHGTNNPKNKCSTRKHSNNQRSAKIMTVYFYIQLSSGLCQPLMVFSF